MSFTEARETTNGSARFVSLSVPVMWINGSLGTSQNRTEAKL